MLSNTPQRQANTLRRARKRSARNRGRGGSGVGIRDGVRAGGGQARAVAGSVVAVASQLTVARIRIVRRPSLSAIRIVCAAIMEYYLQNLQKLVQSARAEGFPHFAPMGASRRQGTAMAPAEKNYHVHLRKAELGTLSATRAGRKDVLRQNADYLFATRQPALLKEREISLEGVDKVFASAWLSDDEVVCGTKCNQLFVYNIKKKIKVDIPLLQGDAQPTPISSSPDNCGIHSIAISPSKTLLATGGVDPNHIGIYRLPSFEPLLVCEGHRDWIFTLQWLSDDILVSGSRDTKVCWWSIKNFQEGHGSRYGMFPARQPEYSIAAHVPHCAPSASRMSHKGKVRDLKYNAATRELATLSADTSVKIWDVEHYVPVTSVHLSHGNETVCIALDERRNTYAVGSQSHISFIDPRRAAVTSAIDSMDHGAGVRSIVFRHDVLTIGGGLGRISFFDLRAMKYIDIERPAPQNDVFIDEAYRNKYHETSQGWLLRNDLYRTHFAGAGVSNAVYTLNYDLNGHRLFAAGGPLQSGLCGSYAALWY